MLRGLEKLYWEKSLDVLEIYNKNETLHRHKIDPPKQYLLFYFSTNIPVRHMCVRLGGRSVCQRVRDSTAFLLTLRIQEIGKLEKVKITQKQFNFKDIVKPNEREYFVFHLQVSYTLWVQNKPKLYQLKISISFEFCLIFYLIF